MLVERSNNTDVVYFALLFEFDGDAHGIRHVLYNCSASRPDVVYFALLFEFDGDAHGIRHVLYNCSASRPSIESETKEDSIEPGKEKLSLTADPREDGLVKSRTGDETAANTYKNWYKAVYIPQDTTAPATGA